jgi:hypothetical protein
LNDEKERRVSEGNREKKEKIERERERERCGTRSSKVMEE